MKKLLKLFDITIILSGREILLVNSMKAMDLHLIVI